MQLQSLKREGNTLHLLWEDAHHSILEIGYLRRKCQCVSCKNNTDRTPDGGIALPSFSEKPLDILKIEPIGRYALFFQFSDGHTTGIYPYDYLRKICPCPECQNKTA
jgi:DUF971 family protein